MLRESKHADVIATRRDNFFYAWENDDGIFLSVEYIPANYPCLTVITDDDRTKEEIVDKLEEINFVIERP